MLLNWLHQLSIEMGALVVMVLSALVGVLWCALTRSWLARLVFSGCSSVGIAYALYWLPVWLGDDPSEYSSWSGMVIRPWALAGLAASALVLVILRPRAVASQ